MPNRASRVSTDIRQEGVYIDVVIKPPGSPLAGIKTRGLIDTGADFILITSSIARQLQLRHVNNDVIGGIGGGEMEARVHIGQIEVPHLQFRKTLPLYAIGWSATSHAVLLGRSFLEHFVFIYDGPSQVFHFSLPLEGGYHRPGDAN